MSLNLTHQMQSHVVQTQELPIQCATRVCAQFSMILNRLVRNVLVACHASKIFFTMGKSRGRVWASHQKTVSRQSPAVARRTDKEAGCSTIVGLESTVRSRDAGAAGRTIRFNATVITHNIVEHTKIYCTHPRQTLATRNGWRHIDMCTCPWAGLCQSKLAERLH